MNNEIIIANLLKKEVISKFALNEKDVGSYPVQIAILTWDILHLTEHMKNNKKDLHSLKGLKNKVSQRKRLIKKYDEESSEECKLLITQLAIRIAK